MITAMHYGNDNVVIMVMIELTMVFDHHTQQPVLVFHEFFIELTSVW